MICKNCGDYINIIQYILGGCSKRCRAIEKIKKRSAN